LRARPNSEADLGLLAVVHGEALQHETAKTTASTPTYRIVDHEALQACAIVGKLADAIQNQINDLFANGVMTAGEVIGSVFFPGDQLFWMEELTVCASAHLVDDSWLEINHDAPRDMLASAGFTEEGIERIVATTNSFVAGHLTIWLNAVFEAEELPARIANLNTTLTDVKAKGFAHCCNVRVKSLS